MMDITRRSAIGILASSPAAVAAEQQGAAAAAGIDVKWLEGVPAAETGVSWGVPFARGSVARSQTFQLTAADGKAVPLQQWPLAYWPDGSMKFLGFATVAGANAGAALRLAPGTPARGALTARDSGNAIEIDTGKVQARLAKSGTHLIESLRMDGREVAREGRLVCLLEGQTEPFTGTVKSATLEQSGPVRAVVKLEGMHKQGAGREFLPFVVRLYFYSGSEQIRAVHSIVFDGDQEKDFIKGLGFTMTAPMREEVHNRHVRFSADGDGVWSEPVQPATGRRPLMLPGTRTNAFEEQLAGKRLPNKSAFDASGQKLLTDWAVWDSYKLVQPNADGFTVQKRTNPQSCWLDAGWGRRSSGYVFAGDVTGGLGIGLKNFWQSYPASLEVHGASGAAADVTVWMWSPDAPAMDLRHYDIKGHDLLSSYEDVQPGFSTAHGVGRTSDFTLFPAAGMASREETAAQAGLASKPPLLAASPAHIHAAKVFGIWSLPDRSTPAKAALEDKLDAAFAVYHKEVEQRHWYGFWNYGDVMHQHDGPRHTWRYDVGGFAWDNTELGTDIWLWYTFLRTGRADAFRMAEAITRHTSDVDCYHLGRFAGLGSRHNVRHWGCGAKEARISQAPYRRFHYYLTTDERTGDLMRAVSNNDTTFIDLDPMRLASPRKPGFPYPARLRSGPDWLALVGNWMTEWERTGDTKWRDKILAGMDSIAAMKYGFLTGPDQLLGYDPKTNKLYPIVEDGMGTYNLATIMGGGELVFELNDIIEHPGWKKAWDQYCRLHTAPKDVVLRDKQTGNEGMDARWARPGRLSAYLYREHKDAAFAKKAWAGVRVPSYATRHFEGPVVAEPIDEIPGLSTNTTSQGCLEAIEVLEMCGEFIP